VMGKFPSAARLIHEKYVVFYQKSIRETKGKAKENVIIDA